MRKHLVYFERWMDPVGEELIQTAGGIETHCLRFADSPSDNWTALSAAHGYQLLPSTETALEFYPGRDLIARCPHLLAVSVSGAGYDMVDVAACTEAGIAVVNQAGANSESVAQHALAMMLAVSKQMVQADRAIRRPARDWDRWDFTGAELTGRTLGIIGLGNIGRRVAEICATAFSMKVLAYDPYLEDADFPARHAEKASLGRVMSESDFVSVHCPLTDETRGMIGAEQFAVIKEGAIFISTARGGIHDEMDLAGVLASGQVAGAGLDVFESEPPPHDHPLLAFDNVIVSPHHAGVTVDCLYNMARSAAEQWQLIFSGRRPPRLINPDAWPRFAERYAAAFGAAAAD